MRSRAPLQLGPVQQQIMEVLWRAGHATARQVTEELSRRKPIAHSTVQTLLRQLEAKGVVTHEVTERTFLFRPLCQPADLTTPALRELLARAFHGSVASLVAHLFEHETISPEERQRLRELIEGAGGEPAGITTETRSGGGAQRSPRGTLGTRPGPGGEEGGVR